MINELNNEELTNIEGGAFKLTATFCIVAGAVAAFAIGVYNGLKRPLSCASEK